MDGPSSTWQPVDLGPYLRGENKRLEPSVGLRRTDGLALLYPGREHTVIGETESGKSWLAVASVAAELMAGRPVLYIHFEEGDPSDTLDRLRALGVPVSDLLEWFRFVGPEEPVQRERLDALLDPAPSLVVLDGVNEALSLLRLKDDADGIATYRRHLVKPCTRVGAATLSCDHVVKNPEARAAARGPMGSGHRINGLTGVLIDLSNVEPFGHGKRGRSHVQVHKDRPAYLRQHGRPVPGVPGRTYMGELVVDDTQATSPDLTLRFYAPRTDDADSASEQSPATGIVDQVHDVLLDAPDRQVETVTELRARIRAAGIKARNTDVADAIADLLLDCRIEEVKGKGRRTGYRATSGSHTPHPTAVPTSRSASGSPKEGEPGTTRD